MKLIKIAYIGGGSKQWARCFMQDLSLAADLGGQVCLYDIDKEAAQRNQFIGNRIQAHPKALSSFFYTVVETLEDCLTGADFVLISILPGTFREMRSDVHAPEKYGIYQSVGDTVGPGGVLRAMRTVPIYEGFAKAIRERCPNAWVLNLTNPMTACVKALYDTFPEIKAFGCCHEVFHAQDFLCAVLKETTGIKATRRDIYTDASGINHFTWITEARFQNHDLMGMLPGFIDKYFESGYEQTGRHDAWKTDTFAYNNRVKMDMFNRFGALGAAGDRHLAEFMNNSWYLGSPEMVKEWKFGLTTVDFREKQQEERIQESIALAKCEKELLPQPSGEELVRMLQALCGLNPLVSNVNLPNRGQMPGMPMGAIVETNCVFTNGMVKPVVANPLPEAALALVQRNSSNISLCCEGIRQRDLDKIFASFMNQPLCSGLSFAEGKALFHTMCENTKEYLAPYYPQLT